MKKPHEKPEYLKGIPDSDTFMPFRSDVIPLKKDNGPPKDFYLPLTRNKYTHRMLKNRDNSLETRQKQEDFFTDLIENLRKDLKVKPRHTIAPSYLTIRRDIDNNNMSVGNLKIGLRQQMRMHDLSPRINHDSPNDKFKFYRDNMRSGYSSQQNFFQMQSAGGNKGLKFNGKTPNNNSKKIWGDEDDGQDIESLLDEKY